MELEGRPAFCPTCQQQYTFYDESSAHGAREGRLSRPCFACSFRTSRWDALWIPGILLVVASFPLLWMIWSNLIGPLVFLSPFALALWRRLRRRIARAGPDGDDTGSAIAPQAE